MLKRQKQVTVRFTEEEYHQLKNKCDSTLTAQRGALYRGKSKTTPADYSEQIQALTARIRELRREITTCADIEMDCEMVQDKVQRAAHRRENPPRERIHRRAY